MAARCRFWSPDDRCFVVLKNNFVLEIYNFAGAGTDVGHLFIPVEKLFIHNSIRYST